MSNYPIHPDVASALDKGRVANDRFLTVSEMFGKVVARKSTDDGLIAVECTGGGKIQKLFLGDGVLQKYRGDDLEIAILTVVDEAIDEAFAIYKSASESLYASR